MITICADCGGDAHKVWTCPRGRPHCPDCAASLAVREWPELSRLIRYAERYCRVWEALGGQHPSEHVKRVIWENSR
jgi:hypothetical protein